MEDDPRGGPEWQTDLENRLGGCDNTLTQREEEACLSKQKAARREFALFDSHKSRDKTTSPDCCIRDEESLDGIGELRGLKERVSGLSEGLLKSKELSEWDLSQHAAQGNRDLPEKWKERLLLAHRQKEEVEKRGPEWETSEEEQEVQIQTLVGEMAERDSIQAQLVEAHGQMVIRLEEVGRCKRRMEARIQQLESELTGVGSAVEEVERNHRQTVNEHERLPEDVQASPNENEELFHQRNCGTRVSERSRGLESPVLYPDGGSSKAARLEKLLELREETVAELQGRLAGQEQLLRDMQETQRKLSVRNEELNARQRDLSDELHRWRAKGSGLEQREREMRAEIAQLRDTVAHMEVNSATLEGRLKAKASELKALEASKQKETSSLLSDMRKLTLDQADREAAWLRERQGLEAQLRKRSKELEVSEEQQQKLRQVYESLEEEQQRLRQAEGALVQKNQAMEAKVSHLSQLLTSTQDSLARERQVVSTAKTQLTHKDQKIKQLQEQEAALHSTIKHLQEDLQRAWRERVSAEEAEAAAGVSPELQVLSQRVKVLEHSLRDNVNTFTESEAALQNRIKELEVSERNLLVKVDDLTARSGVPCPATPRQRQEDKLHMLREEVRTMALDKERCERVWKERLHRCQHQVKMKEEEMKRQSEYFEHYKQKLQQKLGLSKEREQGLQSRVFQLEREVIDLTATAALLRTELERQAPGRGAPPLDAEAEEAPGLGDEPGSLPGEGRLKGFISSLQEDLRELLGREEAGLAERRGLREGLQDAEDNVEFLSRKLEDFRSRIHELKLSESALLEEVEELAEENERLRGGLRTQNEIHAPLSPNPNPTPNPPATPSEGVGPEQQELKPVDSTDSTGAVVPGEDPLQGRRDTPLRPARDRSAQTPSLTHCIKEAITIARLLEGSFLPLLESNSWAVVEIMQALRCGGVEQVKQTLQQQESQSRLPVLECEDTPLPDHQEGAVECSAAKAVLLSKHKETVVVHSQPDLLRLFGHGTQNTNLISLVTKTIDVDCNPADGGTPSKEYSFRSYSFGTFNPPREAMRSLKETVWSLESEVDSLQNNKKDLETILHSKEEALQRASEENARQKSNRREKQAGGSSEEQEASRGERGHLQLETLKNNWRQENKVLARRNEELLEQITKMEGDYERELTQLRLQISLQERDEGQLEEENRQHCCVIAELQQKMEDDLNVIVELQDALRERSEQIAVLQQKTEDDLNLIMELQEALREKSGREGGEIGMLTEEERDKEDLVENTTTLESEETVLLRSSLEESREALCLLQTEKAQQQALIDRLEEEKQQSSQNIEELRGQVERLSGLVSQLKDELQAVRTEKDGLANQNHDLSARLEKLIQTNANLTHKVEDQQEAIKISSEMISDLQKQRDDSVWEVTRLQEANAASEQELLPLREASKAISSQLSDLQDQKVQLARLQEEKSQLQRDMSIMQTQHANVLKQQDGEIQTLRETNENLSEKIAALQGTERAVSERNTQLCQEVDSLMRENQALIIQIQMLEVNKELGENTAAYSTPPKGSEIQVVKDVSEVGCAVRHNTEKKEQETEKELEVSFQLSDVSQNTAVKGTVPSPRHKMALEITQKSRATVFSYKTVNLGNTFQDQPSTIGDKGDLPKELETMATELKRCQEELEKARAEAQKWYRELGLAEARGEEAEKKASQAANEVKRMRESGADAEQLRVEVEALKSKLAELEDRKDTIRALKVHSNDLRHQFDELLKTKTQTDLEMAPLKAKLSCMVQKCQERNSLIVQMVRALRRYGCIDCTLTQEAEDLVNDTALLEYSCAFSPAASRTQDPCKHVWETTKINEDKDSAQPSLSCSQGGLSDADTSLSFRLCVAKADYCPSPDMPQTVLPTLPLIAGESVQVTGVPDSRGLYHAKVKGEAGLVPACFLEEKADLHHRALPSAGNGTSLGSKLTSPEKIISFHHQLQQSHCSNYQVISGSDPSPETGSGCVPTSSLPQDTLSDLSKPAQHPSLSQESREDRVGQGQEQQGQQQTRGSGSGEPARRSARDSAGVLNNPCPSREEAGGCTPSADSCRKLSDLSILNSQGQNVRPVLSHTLVPEARSIRAKQEPPAPVGSLEVIKTVGQSSLMIGWERPPLDELGCSNGTFVYGYRIYVDGEFHKSVMSSACTKAVLENLDLSVPVHISVQTLGSNGLFAEKVHVLYKSSSPSTGSAPPPPDMRASILRRNSGTTQPIMYRSLQLKSSSPKSAVKPVMFVAIYNYSPLKDSPNIHPSRELAFREGDTVWVFGTPRRDGFCEAEVNGRRGLAPVAFLEEIPMGQPRTRPERTTGCATGSPGADDLPCAPSCSMSPLHGRKAPVRRL
ncbi:rootletin-like [Megalops cyprinoides]|uniref:rootletin-like n=1 Tax=Megalops cyprinoides TaxID=118141 RepID=UPI001865189D|nr:rootletin-like [Megalops cyprinoides]